MKKLFLFALLTYALSPLLFSSCSADKDLALPDNGTSQIPAEHLDIIARLGLDHTSAVEFDEHYIVEGDIMIYKEGIEDYLSGLPETRQARYSGALVSDTNLKAITYTIKSSVEAGWQTAIANAVQAWNGAENSKIRISLGGSNADIEFSVGSYPSSATTIATGSFPLSGKPGKTITVNSKYDYFTVDQKTAVIVHELGHNLGFYHTDWESLTGHYNGMHIEGTVKSDSNSIMNSKFNGLGWTERGGFSKWDALAIELLYAVKSYVIPQAWLKPSLISVGHGQTFTFYWQGPLGYRELSGNMGPWLIRSEAVDINGTPCFGEYEVLEWNEREITIRFYRAKSGPDYNPVYRDCSHRLTYQHDGIGAGRNCEIVVLPVIGY